MKRSSDAMDDGNEVLTFRSRGELMTYMQNRLIELGFDTTVRNALRVMFNSLEGHTSLYIVYI